MGFVREDGTRDTAADRKAVEGMCGAIFQMILKSSEFADFQSLPVGLILTINARVDCQAGERVGAGNGPRLGSQRPEFPTAQGIFRFEAV